MTKHGIHRKEWERRFHASIAERAITEEGRKLSATDAAATSEEEIESWGPETADWETTLPEDAANEQMMNWSDGQDP